MTPDPTVLATLGGLLLLPRGRATNIGSAFGWVVRALWIVPLAWASLSGATLWTLGSSQGLLLPALALALALALAAWPGVSKQR